MPQIRVGIINVTGYAGIELARLLARHPGVELVSVTGRSAAGQPLAAVFPHLADLGLTVTAELGAVDLAFSAMPHRESVKEVAPLLASGVKVVDISADFRLTNAADYPEWYDFRHPAPELIGDAVYGLPELYRSRIEKTALVANPGCYPTGAILALAPAVNAGLITGEIIVDSKSGVSGAGRSLSLNSHFAEASDDVQAYALAGHRHLPEIFQQLALVGKDFEPRVTFVPHLVPMARGILSTCYAPLAAGRGGLSDAELARIYRDFYQDAPFVRVTDAPPHTKHTWGANHCLVYPTRDARTGRLVVVSCLDNLVKGAAGQAIQNMNLMLGLPETSGLEGLAVFP